MKVELQEETEDRDAIFVAASGGTNAMVGVFVNSREDALPVGVVALDDLDRTEKCSMYTLGIV